MTYNQDMHMETKLKKWTLGKWKKEFWTVFTEYIKLRDGYTCITCGKKGSGSGIHGGHFIPRSVGGLSLFFHEDNVHAQCIDCNINKGGYGAEYYPKLVEKIGQKRVDELFKLRDTGYKKYSKQDYADAIALYQFKIDSLKKQ